jgi:arylsulfatase A-like enzyme
MKFDNWIALLICSFALAACNSKTTPPNIIFLLADDHRWDALGAAGNPIIRTPHLDSIAGQGIWFKNAFVTTSICASSRASILTGQYVSRNGVTDFKTELSSRQFERTYPMLLKKNGYQIGFVGKYGIGHSDLKREKKAFDYFWGQNRQPKYENVTGAGDTIHYTDLIEKHSLEFIDQAASDRPFCLSVSFKAPHVQDGDPRQFIYKEKFRHLYQNDYIPLPEISDSVYLERFPNFFRDRPGGKMNEARRRWEIRFSTPDKYQESVKGYYRLVTGVDEVVGKIRKKLAKKKLDKNTVIIFMGDNGFFLGEHGLAGKWYGHEPSIRVPLLIYDPSLERSQRGKIFEELALNIDIAPTILQLAGIAPADFIQGTSLTQLYRDGGADWREGFYYEHLLPAPIIPRSQGIRTQRYKYLLYPDSPEKYEEVYDLDSDPLEKNNIARDPQRENLLLELRDKYENYQQQAK